MSDGSTSGIDRRGFLQLAAVAALPAASAVGANTPSDSASPTAGEKDSGLPTVFRYGYDAEPYPLDAGPHLFIDWRYVSAGGIAWQTADGREARELADELAAKKVNPNSINAETREAPYGIRLVGQPAEKIGPVIKLDRDWEYRIDPYTSLHRIDGKYRYWYEVEDVNDTESRLLCYAESEDGVSWTKPELGLVDWKGNKRNNIVFGGPLTPPERGGFHGSTIMHDPSAPAEERWKLMWMGRHSEQEMKDFQKAHPNHVNPIAMRKRRLMLGATSPDGLRWTAMKEPLFAHFNDSQPTIYYDEFLKRYVGYFRMLVMDRRVIGRAETTDFRRWPVPEMVLCTDPSQSPSVDFYTQSRGIYPRTRTAHLMFPSFFDRPKDTLYPYMASSLDGKSWTWVPGGPFVKPGPEGSWDGGCIFVGNGLTEIAGDRVAVPFTGYRVPHKFPRMIRQGEIGLAAWPKERIVALTADDEGGFHTPAFKVRGKKLLLNFRTPRTGRVRVEVVGDKQRTLANCDPLWGDQPKAPVSWKGDTSLGAEELQLRFHLRSAELFSFEVRD